MRKILCFLAFFLLIAFALYANETPDEGVKSASSPKKTKNLNFGAGFVYTNNPEIYGGNFEFGFDLYKNVFFIQNKFVFRAGGFKMDGLDNTSLTLSEKIAFGRNDDDVVSLYVYMEGGGGFFGNSQQSFSRDTLTYNFGFGGGVELGNYTFGSFYIEIGYIGQKMNTNYPLSGVLLQTGWRIYL